jgi:hypothetical protein
MCKAVSLFSFKSVSQVYGRAEAKPLDGRKNSDGAAAGQPLVKSNAIGSNHQRRPSIPTHANGPVPGAESGTCGGPFFV